MVQSNYLQMGMATVIHLKNVFHVLLFISYYSRKLSLTFAG